MRLPLAVFAAVTTGFAAADDLPKGGGHASTVRVKVEGDRLVTIERNQTVRKRVVIDRSGGEEKERVIEVTSTHTSTVSRELKTLRVTDTDDKDIPLADFTDRFKEEGYVVWLRSPLDASWKKKFRGDTVFVEVAHAVSQDKPTGK